MQHAQTLETIHRLTHRHWMKSAGALGLSYSEFEYLSAIYEQAVLSETTDHHGQHLHDIVTAMGVNKASASAMMDKLEKRKLVRVKPCKRDARAKHFLLSKKGEELRVIGKSAYELLASVLEADILAILSPAPVQTVAALEHMPDAPKEEKKPRAKKKAEPKPKEPAEQADALPQLSLFG
ncbi:MarR family winged helix-turn-helix transcriptional regulator [Maritalea porphyrae]|uniref:MarR family winged helix-turn-helix transcriptional regulator n=1 Tax=Maritalea porphyrae TaxID=880732 RepID=UPI0022AEC3CA|nr:MarR family transcriptional regulator [Maritalea porphyrae]MCZ4270800.1 MarR family transcriptional regulator [Maritalea porphyrae]